jgi:hypothetical protein
MAYRKYDIHILETLVKFWKTRNIVKLTTLIVVYNFHCNVQIKKCVIFILLSRFQSKYFALLLRMSTRRVIRSSELRKFYKYFNNKNNNKYFISVFIEDKYWIILL